MIEKMELELKVIPRAMAKTRTRPSSRARRLRGRSTLRPLLGSMPIHAHYATLKGFEGPVGFVRVLRQGPDPPEDRCPAPSRVGSSVRAYQFCLAVGGQ
jgi:hypothetical protein